MMGAKPFILLILLYTFMPVQIASADDTSSETYRIELTQSACNPDDDCSGSINIYDKKTGALFQAIPFETSGQSIDEIKESPAPVLFGDFNFDGNEDFAVQTDLGGMLGHYNIYLFDETKKKFVLNKAFTKLATDSMGMFNTDKKRKRLLVSSKSGCCFHYDAEFEVAPNNKPIKVYEHSEKYSKDAKGDYLIVIENKLYNGKWHKKVTRQAIKPDAQLN